jgi:hypothetical protein
MEPKGSVLCSPYEPVLSQMNPVYALLSFFFEITSVLSSHSHSSLCRFLHLPVDSSWTQMSDLSSCYQTPLCHFFYNNLSDQVLHPCKARDKIIVSSDSILKSCIENEEVKITEWQEALHKCNPLNFYVHAILIC